MADPICRWRNSSVKQVTEFNVLLPLKPKSKKEGRELVEKRWQLAGGKDFFSTPYQLALQMGMYFEDEYTLHPRFSTLISLEEADIYIKDWAKKYYAPNPYTKSMSYDQKPVIINNYLVNWVYEHENPLFSEALKTMFSDNLGNTDILVNLINNFMEITIKDDKMFLKSDSVTKYSKVYAEVNKKDKEQFFLYFGGNITNISNLPLQQITYGAPGTGKSHGTEDKIEEIYQDEDERKKNVFRTTFHPDSDYSTFVGCYKPTMGQKKPIYGFDSVGKTTTVKGDDGKDILKQELTYKFVPQAFTKAFIRAYELLEEGKPVFLVIEEINRGNCAQIFGDLFQLLDRDDDGDSKYAIKPDTDLENYLIEKLGDKYDAEEGMKLPPNLHIWATMNTSDQSLFPIDSAFKRRWDWKYVPISDAKKDYKIETETALYDWWDFLQKVNEAVNEVTNGEDKKLGYFFCKGDKEGKISADKFVSKVMFYLYSDVLKDSDGDDVAFTFGNKQYTLLKWKDGDKDKEFKFPMFFNEKGEANAEIVDKFLQNIEVKHEKKGTDQNVNEE